MATTTKRMNKRTMKKLLTEERAALLKSSESTVHDRDPVELDQQSVGRLSRMDALQVQAMAQASEDRRRGRLQRIESALKRIEDGDYGECVECGEVIPPKRLEIDPTVTHCVECAS